MKYSLILSLTLLWSSIVQGSAMSIIDGHGGAMTIDDVGDARLVGRFMEYCLCPSDAGIEDIASGRLDSAFKPNHEDRLHLTSKKGQDFWVKFSVINPFPEPRLRTLLMAYNTGRSWELYHRDGSGFQKMVTGHGHGGSGFYPHFSVNLHPGLNQIYVKFSAQRVSFWFGKEEKVANVTQGQLYYASTMLTIALLITLGSLSVALLLRNQLFAYYALYTSSSFLFILASSNIPMIFGYNVALISAFTSSQIINLCMGYELVTTLLFINHLLQLSRWAPIIYRILTVFGASVFTFLLAQSFLSYSNDILLTSLILIYCVLITAVFIYATYRGVDNGKKGLLSWSAYVAGIAASSVLILGSNPLSGLNVSWASMILEMLLFGFLSARDLYLRQVKMSEEKEHSYKQLQKLVYPEQLDMMREGRFLEETMPVEQAQAVVLCLDIINSTKIDPNKNHAFFQDFFVRCQLLMNEGINVSGEKVRLFRVKEMGDGFICSIGFPMACGVNQAEVAVAFLDRVAVLFWECAERHLQSRPCGFGAGIAGGTVGGYFPRSGIKQYDLYGMAIVLATRYESMRHRLEDKLPEGGSVIIVQDTIFQKLPTPLKSRFECFSLKQETFKVRDDPDAKQFWFGLLNMPEHDGQIDGNERKVG
ncbi:MAG: hypothetical protein M3Q07_21995 [Pseudobdellovibrionaceae bacterium]|nr:hypothetical protein [Pseudobdellovibrionaceae bacterium]